MAKYAPANIETKPENTRAGWKWVGEVQAFADKPGAVWRLSLKPGDSPAVVDAIRSKLPAQALYDWGGGLVWLLTPDEDDGGEAIVRASVDEVGGHATLVRHGSNTKVNDIFHPQPAGIAAISTEMRRQFDTHSILNPGRMGE